MVRFRQKNEQSQEYYRTIVRMLEQLITSIIQSCSLFLRDKGENDCS
jgi:hypothetical protein